MDLDDFNFQIFKIRIIQAKLSFEGLVGHPAALPEEIQDLIEKLIKVHHALLPSFPGGVRRRTRLCEDQRHCRRLHFARQAQRAMVKLRLARQYTDNQVCAGGDSVALSIIHGEHS